MIVPTAPGGGYDTYARALAPVIEAQSGLQPAVVNMPSSRGMVALTTLANAAPDDLVVLVQNGADILRIDQGSNDKWVPRLYRLAIFHSEPSALVGKPDLSIEKASTLVAANGTTEQTVLLDLIGRALGKEVKQISGYGGSKEMEGAVLRGEADIMTSSLTTSLKSAKSGDLALKLILTDKPNDRAAGVPHIGGEDGMAAALAKDLAPAERAKRIELANLALYIGYDVRTVFTHSTLRADLRDCLTEAVNKAIRDPAFAKAAEAQGRPVTPLDPADAKTLVDAQTAAIDEASKMTAAP
jgi:tripartite-type tricarboxylate transporter receptor subunit TctC